MPLYPLLAPHAELGKVTTLKTLSRKATTSKVSSLAAAPSSLSPQSGSPGNQTMGGLVVTRGPAWPASSCPWPASYVEAEVVVDIFQIV